MINSIIPNISRWIKEKKWLQNCIQLHIAHQFYVTITELIDLRCRCTLLGWHHFCLVASDVVTIRWLPVSGSYILCVILCFIQRQPWCYWNNTVVVWYLMVMTEGFEKHVSFINIYKSGPRLKKITTEQPNTWRK